MMTDGACKWDYASVIFVDPAGWNRQTLNLFFYHSCCVPYAKIAGSPYLSKTMVQRTQNMLVYSIRISQGSVATLLGCDRIFNDSFIAHFLRSVPVGEFW